MTETIHVIAPELVDRFYFEKMMIRANKGEKYKPMELVMLRGGKTILPIKDGKAELYFEYTIDKPNRLTQIPKAEFKRRVLHTKIRDLKKSLLKVRGLFTVSPPYMSRGYEWVVIAGRDIDHKTQELPDMFLHCRFLYENQEP